MLKQRFAAIAAMIGLIFATIVGISTPASAATDDATLSGLSISSGMTYRDTGLGPGFESTRTWYYYSSTKQENTIVATANDAGATIQLLWSGNTQSITSGNPEVLTFKISSFPMTVRVTASDGTTTKNYTVMMNIGLMMQPQFVSITPNSGGDLAGEHVHLRLRNAAIPTWNNNSGCEIQIRGVYPDGSESYMWGNFQSVDNNGVADYVMEMRTNWGNDWYEGKVNLRFTNYCWNSIDDQVGNWREFYSTNLVKDAYEFKPLQLDVPPVLAESQMTPTGRIKLTGFGINSRADIWGFMADPAKPGSYLYFWNWGWIDNSTGTYRFDEAPYDTNWDYNFTDWNKPGKKTLYILKCGTSWNGPTGCWKTDNGNAPTAVETLRAQGNLLWSGEINYTPDVPTMVSVSPNKGSIAGGNKIRIRGHHMWDYRNWSVPQLKIGDQSLTDVRWVNTGDIYDPNSIDVLEGTVPAALKAGTYPITLTNHWGDNLLSVKYTYSAKPEISSIAPAAVSNSGGSLVTLTGKNFGTSGTPAVTIDGVKSPCVTRVSDTKVVAMVPATSRTGAVDVNMISGAGGGSPDLPASLTLNAAGSQPTISKVAPSAVSIGGGDEVVLTGTGFGAAGTVGVMVGGNCARVTASTSTSVTIEVPSGDAAGATDITVGSTTGTLVKVGALTYNPTPGVSKVEPSSIPSYATGDAAKIVITGNGFGSGGKIKFGANAAVNYTATDGGTKISGVVVPTTAAGILLITITPTGATTSFTSSVKVRAPKPTYFGPNPHKPDYEWATGWEDWKWSAPVTSSTAGGAELLIEGTDFGTAGSVNIGTTAATIKSWTDTAIIISTPALSLGAYDVVVTPSSGGGVSATLPVKLNYMPAAVEQPTISLIAATVDNGRNNAQHTFDAELDRSDVFQVTGTGFNGTDSGASTKVYLKDDNSDWVAVAAYDLTSTSFKFHAPRSYVPIRWVSIRVVTNIGEFSQVKGILYVGNPPQPITFGGWYGLCAKTAIGAHNPSSFATSGPSGTFGSAGTVTIGGVALPAESVTWSDTGVTADFGSISGSWNTLWGNQTVVFTPSDTNLIPRTFNYFCGVATSVTTKLNASTADLTINAGTAYTASASFVNPLPGFDYTPTATGYQYVKASDWAQGGFSRNVISGLPVAAGEYYVRVDIGAGTYDRTKYATLSWDNDSVHLTITGTPVTFTPKLTSGAATEITYNGPITDGTDGKTANFMYTKTSTADTVTSVTWEFRDHLCAGNNNVSWNYGLPQSVAIAPQGCGGDGSSVSSWDIRVRSFDMIVNGVNKNIYYLPTFDTFTLKINKKGLTISKVKAEKVYDGTTSISFNEIEVTGAVNDEVPILNSQVSSGNFADATPGTGKAITLGGALALAGGYNTNYFLTNPDIVFTGTIKKADAQLRLTSSVPSVIMTNPASFELTATVRDMRTWQPPSGDAGLSPVVISSGSASVCTVSGTTVTPLKAGDCVLSATQAASVNYNASKSYQDDSLTTETIVVKIFASPKAVQVVADDITLATGESVTPSAQVIGLIDGDELNTVAYDYYQGTTLLSGAPTDPGTYKIVPRDATLTATDMAAYQPDFKYVAGKLIITQVPPIFASMTPGNGPEAGGTKVTIVGERLGDITSISWGSLTIRKPNFVVNGDGTEITLTVPKGTGQIDVVMRAGVIEIPTTYVYDAPVTPPVTAPFSLNLTLDLLTGTKLAGQEVTISGGGLKANSEYVLELHSTLVIIYKALTDADGNFSQKIILPAKSCVEAGTHYFRLVGVKPDGAAADEKAYFQLGEKCIVGQGQAVKTVVNDKVTWTLSGFLFKYRDEHLTAEGKKSLDTLFKLIKGSKVVKIYGYTETDTKSAKIKKANLILAKARCLEVQKYLRSKGLKVKYYLYGKGGVNPISLTDQAQNRRVVIDATY